MARRHESAVHKTEKRYSLPQRLKPSDSLPDTTLEETDTEKPSIADRVANKYSLPERLKER